MIEQNLYGKIGNYSPNLTNSGEGYKNLLMDLRLEKELVERAKTDDKALEILYDTYYHPIFNYILRRTAKIDIAQDLTSEVFLKVCKNLWKYRWMNISLSAWLYRIASNEIVNYFRQTKIILTSLDTEMEKGKEPINGTNPEEEFLMAEEELKRKEEHLKIQKIVLQLPLKYQEVLVLRYFEKKKISEICEILGKKEGTVNSLLSRGLDKLKLLLQASADKSVIEDEG